jgi:hypothetical protein
MPTEMLLMPLPESPELLQVLEDCEACHRVCMHSAMTQCLEQGGEHVEPNHFRLLMTCVNVCNATATSIAGGFDIQEQLCRLCAEVCRACAESCRRVGDLEDCVDVCERCARSCNRLLGVPPPEAPRQNGAHLAGRL